MVWGYGRLMFQGFWSPAVSRTRWEGECLLSLECLPNQSQVSRWKASFRKMKTFLFSCSNDVTKAKLILALGAEES